MKDYHIDELNRKQFIDLLEREKYDRFNGNYDYITTMSIDSVAKYKIDDLSMQIKNKENELKAFMKKTCIDLWKQDLIDLVEMME